jgi:hypothetical protein
MTEIEGSLTLPDGIELYTKTWKVRIDLRRDWGAASSVSDQRAVD